MAPSSSPVPVSMSGRSVMRFPHIGSATSQAFCVHIVEQLRSGTTLHLSVQVAEQSSVFPLASEPTDRRDIESVPSRHMYRSALVSSSSWSSCSSEVYKTRDASSV